MPPIATSKLGFNVNVSGGEDEVDDDEVDDSAIAYPFSQNEIKLPAKSTETTHDSITIPFVDKV